MSSTSTTKFFTLSEVAKHCSTESLWIVFDDCVYDVTKFLDQHPGGDEVLKDRAGADGTDCFNSVGHSLEAIQKREDFKIGEIVESERKPKEAVKSDAEFPPKEKPRNVFEDYIIPLGIIGVCYYFIFYWK